MPVFIVVVVVCFEDAEKLPFNNYHLLTDKVRFFTWAVFLMFWKSYQIHECKPDSAVWHVMKTAPVGFAC